MGVGVERFQHHLLGSKQEELQRAADLGGGAGMGVLTATTFTRVDLKTNQTCELAHHL